MSNLKRAEVTALAKRPAQELWQDAEWQRLWLSARQRSWSSLAIVPGGAGAPPDFALTIAVTLARIGTMHLGTPVQVADATNMPLIHLAQLTEEIGRLKSEGELVLIAVAPAKENPITVSLAQSADCSMLCILLEVMSAAEARRTVSSIGPPRFIGQAVFHSPPAASPEATAKHVRRNRFG
ncbi:MAG TPA: hypothetical protein VHC69_16505 [Polyangiaceae bacterium]|nr:hypothetical protein [Polyangiaceae bacterium]